MTQQRNNKSVPRENAERKLERNQIVREDVLKIFKKLEGTFDSLKCKFDWLLYIYEVLNNEKKIKDVPT